MTALFFLLAAVWLGWHGARQPWVAAAAVLTAVLAGTTLPDLDLLLGLGHRSGLTHSILPTALACWRRRWWAVTAGLALGIGLHLSADLFPNAMRGYATIKLPGEGSIGREPSYWWIAVNAALGLSVGMWLAARVLPARQAAAVLAVIYLFRTDGGWWALMLFAAAGWLVIRARGLRVRSG